MSSSCQRCEAASDLTEWKVKIAITASVLTAWLLTGGICLMYNRRRSPYISMRQPVLSSICAIASAIWSTVLLARQIVGEASMPRIAGLAASYAFLWMFISGLSVKYARVMVLHGLQSRMRGLTSRGSAEEGRGMGMGMGIKAPSSGMSMSREGQEQQLEGRTHSPHTGVGDDELSSPRPDAEDSAPSAVSPPPAPPSMRRPPSRMLTFRSLRSVSSQEEGEEDRAQAGALSRSTCLYFMIYGTSSAIRRLAVARHPIHSVSGQAHTMCRMAIPVLILFALRLTLYGDDVWHREGDGSITLLQDCYCAYNALDMGTLSSYFSVFLTYLLYIRTRMRYMPDALGMQKEIARVIGLAGVGFPLYLLGLAYPDWARQHIDSGYAIVLATWGFLVLLLWLPALVSLRPQWSPREEGRQGGEEGKEGRQVHGEQVVGQTGSCTGLTHPPISDWGLNHSTPSPPQKIGWAVWSGTCKGKAKVVPLHVPASGQGAGHTGAVTTTGHGVTAHVLPSDPSSPSPPPSLEILSFQGRTLHSGPAWLTLPNKGSGVGVDGGVLHPAEADPIGFPGSPPSAYADGSHSYTRLGPMTTATTTTTTTTHTLHVSSHSRAAGVVDPGLHLDGQPPVAKQVREAGYGVLATVLHKHAADLSSWDMSLISYLLIYTALGRSHFRPILQGEFAVENLLFLLDCLMYRQYLHKNVQVSVADMGNEERELTVLRHVPSIYEQEVADTGDSSTEPISHASPATSPVGSAVYEDRHAPGPQVLHTSSADASPAQSVVSISSAPPVSQTTPPPPMMSVHADRPGLGMGMGVGMASPGVTSRAWQAQPSTTTRTHTAAGAASTRTMTAGTPAHEAGVFPPHVHATASRFATKICARYVQHDAPLSVNLPAAIAQRVLADTRRGHVSLALFYEAELEVLSLLARGPVSRFVGTPKWLVWRDEALGQAAVEHREKEREKGMQG